MNKMPEWPLPRAINLLEVGPYEALAMSYSDERARADAAIARLKVAVEALEFYVRLHEGKLAGDTLDLIGEIPE